jgi:membrane peptidoglycan carboxypeptidase
LEEALIVWLIETQRLVEKDRILEIYLNIIDWGPNINGIAEASKFYFDKDPMKLELNEAIFLASIIPNPNNYTSNFDSLGNFKTGKEDYFRFIAQKMQSRGMIAEEECQNLIYGVALKGPAKEYLHRDSIAQ